MKTNNKSQTKKILARRAQMETIGIAIIVVLVLIGVMFGIQFVLKQEPSEVGTEFRQSQLAANFLNTLAGTTTGYPSYLTFTQLVQECAVESAACGVVQDVAKTILNSTFGAWQTYYFTITKGSGPPLISLPAAISACLAEKQSKSYPIPTRTGTSAIMTLDLC